MIGINKLSFVFVMDTDFYVVGAICFLMMFINLRAYGCHNFLFSTQKFPLGICYGFALSETKNYVKPALKGSLQSMIADSNQHQKNKKPPLNFFD